jgi:hypothetical protein
MTEIFENMMPRIRHLAKRELGAKRPGPGPADLRTQVGVGDSTLESFTAAPVTSPARAETGSVHSIESPVSAAMRRLIMAIDSDVEDDEWPEWLPKNQPEEEWVDDEEWVDVLREEKERGEAVEDLPHFGGAPLVLLAREWGARPLRREGELLRHEPASIHVLHVLARGTSAGAASSSVADVGAQPKRPTTILEASQARRDKKKQPKSSFIR